MSSVNVLPSAPQYGETEPIYPTSPTTDDFRLKKISDLQRELESEADHYRQVAKEYKRARSIVHGSAVGLGFVAAGLSSATALSGFRIIASPPLATLAALSGFSSAALTTFSKRLEKKVTKHEKIYTLAVAKQNSVSDLVSKALTDKNISDSDFSIILREIQKYHKLKGDIRSAKNKKSDQPQPDIEEIKKQIRREERQNLKKKISSLTAESNLKLKE